MEEHLIVDVVSDIICPWCFIGKRRLERAATILGREMDIRWHPFQLNPGMPPGGVGRREYRTAKFGSWERSQQLDERVAENGRQVGIEFRFDRMTRTPNTVRGHMLLAAALKQGLAVQGSVAERLFVGYFTNGEDTGDPDVLRAIARECGVEGDIENPELAADVHSGAEIAGVPLITYEGQLVSEGAAPEETLAATLRRFVA